MQTSTFSYLALGDSYTIGTSVTEVERWPVKLVRALSDADVVTADEGAVRLDYVAVKGWTTVDLRAGIIADRSLLPRYDLVSLMIGVNDYFDGLELDEYRSGFSDLLSMAIERAGGNNDRVFVISIPDYAYTPTGGGAAAITAGVNTFNEAAKIVTETAGVRFLSITEISRDGLDDPDLVAADGLHPSGKQYGRWVDESLSPQVADLLRRIS